jgi:hypothetical protein
VVRKHTLIANVVISSADERWRRFKRIDKIDTQVIIKQAFDLDESEIIVVRRLHLA